MSSKKHNRMKIGTNFLTVCFLGSLALQQSHAITVETITNKSSPDNSELLEFAKALTNGYIDDVDCSGQTGTGKSVRTTYVCLDNFGFTGNWQGVAKFSNGDSVTLIDTNSDSPPIDPPFLQDGVLISTGRASNITNSNNNSHTGTNFNNPGNQELTDQLNNNNTSSYNYQTYDAQIFNFDLMSIDSGTNAVKLDFIFASEEYAEYVNSSFNDQFSILVGPHKNNAARVNPTNEIVSIDNINHYTQQNANQQNSNQSTFFYNNDHHNQNNQSLNFTPPLTGPTYSLMHDGFTTTTTVGIKDLIPTNIDAGNIPTGNINKYNISIGIADAGDGVYDSTVFIGAGAFTPADDPNYGTSVNLQSNASSGTTISDTSELNMESSYCSTGSNDEPTLTCVMTAHIPCVAYITQIRASISMDKQIDPVTKQAMWAIDEYTHGVSVTTNSATATVDIMLSDDSPTTNSLIFENAHTDIKNQLATYLGTHIYVNQLDSYYANNEKVTFNSSFEQGDDNDHQADVDFTYIPTVSYSKFHHGDSLEHTVSYTIKCNID